jgi:hypothetical protein
MAQLIKAGDFVGRGEEPTALHLEQNLPRTWTIICNKELVDPTGSSREVDFIVLAPNAIFVIDEKSWGGEIYGNENGWVLSSGESYLNPLGKVGYLAKRVAGFLRSNVPGLKREVPEHFVFPQLLLSSPGVSMRVQDPRVGAEVVLLHEAHNKLIDADRDFGERCSVGRFARQIKEDLVGLHNRPKIPRCVGEYEVIESMGGTASSRLLRAIHEDGTQRFLRLVKKPVTADAERLRALRNALLREYETLKRLGVKGCSPAVDPYFSWEDGSYWVIPIHPVEGRTLRADRLEAVPKSQRVRQVLTLAFASLSRVHDEGVVHRGLSPDRVFITMRGVLFSDFLIARIGGEATVASQAARLDAENCYWAPECRLGLELSSAASDVYSLAASLYYWITGLVPREDVRFPPVSELRHDLLKPDRLDDLLLRCLEEDDRKRPSASEVVASLPSAWPQSGGESLTRNGGNEC